MSLKPSDAAKLWSNCSYRQRSILSRCLTINWIYIRSSNVRSILVLKDQFLLVLSMKRCKILLACSVYTLNCLKSWGNRDSVVLNYDCLRSKILDRFFVPSGNHFRLKASICSSSVFSNCIVGFSVVWSDSNQYRSHLTQFLSASHIILFLVEFFKHFRSEFAETLPFALLCHIQLPTDLLNFVATSFSHHRTLLPRC
jgi:hypothetical protein